MADIQFPQGSGTLDVNVLDNNGAPSSVLEADTDFTIAAEWSIDRRSARTLGGQWELSAYVESIGRGPEQQVGQTEVVPLDGRFAPATYTVRITVPAGTLPDDPQAPRSGVYKLVTVLILRGPLGQVTDVAAFADGPMLRIG
jgi:hypothetical protein